MNKKKVNKRPSSVIGIKSLIAGAAVVTTIAGWAILPQNDPQYASADAQAIETPIAIATTEVTGTPTAVTAYPTATLVPINNSLLAQPTGTPTTTTYIQVAPSPTTEPTAIPTATSEPTAKPTAKPRAVTSTRSSR